MANGGQTSDAMPSSMMGQLAMQQAAQSGQFVTPTAGANPLSQPVSSGFVGDPSSEPSYGTPFQPFNYQNPAIGASGAATAGGAPDPYSAFLKALDQIQAASPTSAISSATPAVKKGGEAHKPDGNINMPGNFSSPGGGA